MAFHHFYIFFTPRSAFFAKSLHQKTYLFCTSSNTWRWTVSAGVIIGIVLVFLLLGYLVYALINAEAF